MHEVLAFLATQWFVAPALIAGFTALLILLKSLHRIGPLEVGLVRKNFAFGKLPDDCPIAFDGEAGYQAELLKPGIRIRLWPLFSVTKHHWVQIPTNSVGVVVAQIGKQLPQGQKTAKYTPELGDFTDARQFLKGGGEKGVQRPVLQPGTVAPIHPIAFLVLTTSGVYGISVEDEKGADQVDHYGIKADSLNLVSVSTMKEDDEVYDAVGVVTVLDGDPLDDGDIACRLGGWDDIDELLNAGKSDPDIIERVLASKNNLHNNYQDMQRFFDAGGRLGLQHDALMPGQYALNPFLVRVELVPMLQVDQGEVAVVKAFVGLKTVDTSGAEFKHGQIVQPGRRGVWKEPLRTGKYALNRRIYDTEFVPTAILTLNWSERVGTHGLDEHLAAINAMSCEGFPFTLDLQVQIHVSDSLAPRVISAVGSVENLIQEVMRPAVGNFFRNKLQEMSATAIITKRSDVQGQATIYVQEALKRYDVEVRGVYLQDVELPPELVKVLTEREIASQEQATYVHKEAAEKQRAAFEKARGTADIQNQLSRTQVQVEIAGNEASAVKKTAEGAAFQIRELGKAEADKTKAIGLAEAEAYAKQVEALGREGTSLINVARAVGDGHVKIMPDILVVGGAGGGMMDGLAAAVTRKLGVLPIPETKPAAAATTGNGAHS